MRKGVAQVKAAGIDVWEVASPSLITPSRMILRVQGISARGLQKEFFRRLTPRQRATHSCELCLDMVSVLGCRTVETRCRSWSGPNQPSVSKMLGQEGTHRTKKKAESPRTCSCARHLHSNFSTRNQSCSLWSANPNLRQSLAYPSMMRTAEAVEATHRG